MAVDPRLYRPSIARPDIRQALDALRRRTGGDNGSGFRI
jgi:hypothetical protein